MRYNLTIGKYNDDFVEELEKVLREITEQDRLVIHYKTKNLQGKQLRARVEWNEFEANARQLERNE